MRNRVLQIACRTVMAMMGGMIAQRLDAQVFTSENSAPGDHIFRILDEPPSDSVVYLAQRDRSDDRSYDRMPQAQNGTTQQGSDRDGGSDGSNARLIDRVVDPVSWLMQFRFRESWNWPLENTGPDTQKFEFRPTIPFKAWEQVNVMRITVPYTVNGDSGHGLDKVTMFDALVFTPEWGRWAIGPDLRFDPNTGAGDDTFQMGPMFGVIAKTRRWSYGFISQNYLGGNNSESQIQPNLAYKFNDQWALALGDMQFRYSWTDRTWTQLPLGVELDWISSLWGQKIQWFANPQYNFKTTSSNSGWTVFVGLVLLAPGA